MVTRPAAVGPPSPAERNSSDIEPTLRASATFCAPSALTSMVTEPVTLGPVCRSSAPWPTLRTLTFSTTISVVIVEPEAPLALPSTSRMLPALRVSTTSTRSPGVMNPPTPAISSTLMVTARMPGARMFDSVARPFGPDSLASSTGSLVSTGDSTTRPPSDSNASTVGNAPSGNASCGQGISSSNAGSSVMPKRSGALATTIDLNSTFGAAATTGWGWACDRAALLSHMSAANIDAAPKMAAMPIMVMILRFTPQCPSVGFRLLIRVTLGRSPKELGMAERQSGRYHSAWLSTAKDDR